MRFSRPNAATSLRGSIRQHIASLGDSPDAIAERLAGFGVQGVPGKARECAIARYLNAVVAGAEPVTRLAVYDATVRFYSSGRRLPAVVRLTRGASAFVRGFDLGHYPDLVEGCRTVTGPLSQRMQRYPGA